MAKCIVCHCTFEPSEEDKKHGKFHEPAYCSTGCAAKFLKRPVTPDDMWNIHVGPITSRPPEAGRTSGVIADYGKFGRPRRPGGNRGVPSSWTRDKKPSRPLPHSFI